MKLNGYSGTITDRTDLLYGDGATDYRILIPQEATEAEKYAAQELTAIFALAGVTIETVTDAGLTTDESAKFIAIGSTVYFEKLGIKLPAKEFKFDGFIIETLGNTHIIKGVGQTGTCFGTYGFAEYAMGWRYYHPEEQTVEKAAQIYMLTAHLPRVNTITDAQMKELADFFKVDYRKDFLYEL